MTDQPRQWYSIPQTQKILSLSRQRVQAMVDSGELKSRDFRSKDAPNAMIRIPASALVEFEESCKPKKRKRRVNKRRKSVPEFIK